MRTRTRTEVRSSHLRAFRLDDERVALVPEQAVLLAGDHVTVRVRVDAGERLRLVEPGGTVAYAMRGLDARWDVEIEVEPGGALAWDAEPFVVADGADVHRGLRVEAGGAVSLRETLVLGRSGEGPGRLRTRTDVTRAGVPLLVEELDSGVGLGGHRVLDQVLHLGTDCARDGMRLESGDCLHRWLGGAVHESRLYSSSPSPE
ncbi:urease accessory protein UreD [Nocardioides anomalus]|uniref:Urease accessory protein UreD n=1 Tax=Nocardioides anomalus TaxID=2712223 RepID=A0A6G6WDJ0_9ACTN|nr:urease accessory protein UreD [Nocardioides anomalus]QIG43217.1 urease accessory protein UreD [Nocardioides anomalus]